MKIELKGIIQYWDNGHKHVQLVVADDSHVQHVVHNVGIDVKVNRGMILKFLSAIYDVTSADIVWPDHIMAKEGDKQMSLTL